MSTPTHYHHGASAGSAMDRASGMGPMYQSSAHHSPSNSYPHSGGSLQSPYSGGGAGGGGGGYGGGGSMTGVMNSVAPTESQMKRDKDAVYG